MDKTEKKLRQLFNELKTHDARRVPAFNRGIRATLPPASTRWQLMRQPQFALAGVAVILLVAGIAVASSRAHTRSMEKEMQEWAALSDWKAPTDSLLSVSGTPWSNTTTWPADFPTNDDVPSTITIKKL